MVAFEDLGKRNEKEQVWKHKSKIVELEAEAEAGAGQIFADTYFLRKHFVVAVVAVVVIVVVGIDRKGKNYSSIAKEQKKEGNWEKHDDAVQDDKEVVHYDKDLVDTCDEIRIDTQKCVGTCFYTEIEIEAGFVAEAEKAVSQV